MIKSVVDLVGNTPMIELSKLQNEMNLSAHIIAKLESFNPLSSVKDRLAKALIQNGEDLGLINKNTTIIEPTSGNTGIGLAFCAAAKGLSLILTMPETMSIERRSLLKMLGATLILTPSDKGMAGAIEKAKELAAETPNSYMPNQFDNPANVIVHKNTTAQEILKDTNGNIDIFIAGVGTGGTITGVGAVLKQQIPNISIVAVEPADSPVISGGSPASHKIQGIGAGFIPSILDISLLDEVFAVENDEAIQSARLIAKKEGLLVGISSGAALHAAIEIAKRKENSGKRIVVIFPDTGERYISTDLFKME